MAIEEIRNTGQEGQADVARSTSGCCNCHSHGGQDPVMQRAEAQQLLGQLSKMLPRLERALGG